MPLATLRRFALLNEDMLPSKAVRSFDNDVFGAVVFVVTGIGGGGGHKSFFKSLELFDCTSVEPIKVLNLKAKLIVK